MDTDRAWEIWGAREPYYAVLTADRYRGETLTGTDREAFFRSGADHVEQVLAACRELSGGGFQCRRAVDFGCGVGRIVIPLAARFEEVTGVDVADSMLTLAQRNCAAANAGNVILQRTAEWLASAETGFDLVHSTLVFQHIRPRRGLALLRELLSRVAPGGVASVQLIFEEPPAAAARLARLRGRITWLSRLAHRLHGKPFVAPMEMNPYDLGRVFAAFHDLGFPRPALVLGRMDRIRSVTLTAARDQALSRSTS